MRIIAGVYKGRKIEAVPSTKTRPTTDRVREAWASSVASLIPGGSLEGIRALDLFAGSGALGLELLSRGAASCLFVEQDKRAAAILKANIASLGPRETVARVCVADSLSLQLLKCVRGGSSFDLVALDPPYDLPLSKVKVLLSTLAKAGLIVEKCLISYEHAASDTEDMDGFMPCRACTPAALRLVRRKKYGTICLDYYLFQ